MKALTISLLSTAAVISAGFLYRLYAAKKAAGALSGQKLKANQLKMRQILHKPEHTPGTL